MRCIVAVAALAVVAGASLVRQGGMEVASANPIRKVVTMLKHIQAKVEAEAADETKLYNAYMCYCKGGAKDLEASIAANDAKIPQVESAIAEAEAAKAQLESDLKSHQSDRSDAKAAMASASAIREKENKAFVELKTEADANIAAISKAVAALEQGMAGFLQTSNAQVLRSLFKSSHVAASEMDRQTVLEFLAGGYAPSSGEVTGILKQLGDDMSKNLAGATADEEAAVKSFEELMSAKTKELNALTAAIEDKTVRSGETSVHIVEMKNDLSDSGAALVEDKKFLKDLDANCATKKSEWAEIVKARADEQVALSDTISLLENDDALELFKKVLPSAAASLVQLTTSSTSLRTRAVSVIHAAQSRAASPARAGLDFIMLALSGRQSGFDKISKMIDDLISVLAKEQTDDDNKKEYCITAFDSADDKKKSLERAIADSGAAMNDAEESIATLTSEIKNLQETIKSLDTSVAQATEQRKEEHAEYNDLIASNAAAVELLGVAKNRLNKYYNPALYKAPPQRVLSDEDQIAVNMGGTAPPTPAPGGIAGTGITALVQVKSHMSLVDAPAAPPKSFSAYSSKSGDSAGVIAMVDLLIKDLEKEIQIAKTEEANSQENYEQMSADAAEKRAADVSALTDKEAAKANGEAALQAHTDDKASSTKELMATAEYISSLHGECDWILSNFEVRKEARTSEVESLKNAKAVLAGADFSFVQTGVRNLRGLI